MSLDVGGGAIVLRFLLQPLEAVSSIVLLLLFTCFLPLWAPLAIAQEPGVVPVRVDEFKYDATVAITKVNGRTVVEVLKREIEKAMEADGSFRVEATGQAALSGTVRELTIEDIRLNEAGKALQKRVKLRLDFTAVDEASGRAAVKKINFQKEMEYYTELYSLDLGMTDKRMFEEKLLPDLAKAVVAEVKRERKKLPQAKGKEVKVSKEEKAELNAIGKGAQKPVTGTVELDNERINIAKGTVTAGGAAYRHTSRIIQTTTVKLEPVQWDESELKGVTIVKDQPNDLRNMTMQQGLLEYKMNADNTLKAGTVSASLSKMTFDQTLKGLTFERKMKFRDYDQTFMLMGGREFKSNGSGDLPRFSYGSYWKSSFGDLGDVQFTVDLTRDRDPSIVSGARQDFDNRVYGVTGKFKTPVGTELTYDLARSKHRADDQRDSVTLHGGVHDVKMTQKLKNLTVKGEYFFGDEKFTTVFGSATTDRKKVGYGADLPVTVGPVDVKFAADMSRTNKVTAKTTVDVLAQGSANFTLAPFKDMDNKYMKDMSLTHEQSMRHSYDDVLNATAQTKDNDNYKFGYGLSNKFGDVYTASVKFDEEHEHNRLTNGFFLTKEYKWDNTISRTLWEKVKADIKVNYRDKFAGGTTDRFTTYGATFSREWDTLKGQFDYLHDIKRGTTRSQNTLKDRFTLDLSYSKDIGRYKMTTTLRGDYERNRFIDFNNNYNKFTSTANIKVGF